MTSLTSNDVYAREVVMTRVGHLIRRNQREIEQLTHCLRGCFDPSPVHAPEIRRIILIGPNAQRSWYEDQLLIDFSDYKSRIVLNHPRLTSERCSRRAPEIIGRELGDRYADDLEIYAKSDIRTAKAERGTFILDRIEAGITPYRTSRDAPLSPRERRP